MLNGGPAIDLIGVTSFTFNGGDGNDSVTINNPAGGLFGPAGGIFINGGAQTGAPGDSLTLAGGSAGQATYSFGATPDAGTIASADQEVQRLALGGAGSGSFSLTFNGQTTAQLSAAATAAQVQAALNALSSIGGVGGSVVAVQSGTTFTITFGGTLVATDVPQMTATGTGGTTVAVTTLNDGSAAAQSITYTGLDPLANSGSATDIVFNLTAGADQAVLEDNGAAADNTSRLRSNNGTFETTVFGHPASSLTLNAGAGDSVAVDFLDSLGSRRPHHRQPDQRGGQAGHHHCRQRRDVGHRQSGRDRLDRGALSSMAFPTLWRTPPRFSRAAVSRTSIFRFPPWQPPTPDRVLPTSSMPAISWSARSAASPASPPRATFSSRPEEPAVRSPTTPRSVPAPAQASP